MTKAEKTRNFIIEETATIFNKKGYAATSLTDITKATGLTKGSIYGNFKSKEEVGLAAFEFNAHWLQTKIKEHFEKSYATQKEKLLSLTEFYKIQWPVIFEHGGCPLLNAAVDADDTFPDLAISVKNSFHQWASVIEKVLEDGKEKKEFKNDIDVVEYAYLIIMLIEGGIILAKTTHHFNHLNNALARVVRIIDEEIIV